MLVRKSEEAATGVFGKNSLTKRVDVLNTTNGLYRMFKYSFLLRNQEIIFVTILSFKTNITPVTRSLIKRCHTRSFTFQAQKLKLI